MPQHWSHLTWRLATDQLLSELIPSRCAPPGPSTHFFSFGASSHHSPNLSVVFHPIPFRVSNWPSGTSAPLPPCVRAADTHHMCLGYMCQMLTIGTHYTYVPSLHTTYTYHLHILHILTICAHCTYLPYVHTLWILTICTHYRYLPFVHTTHTYHLCTPQILTESAGEDLEVLRQDGMDDRRHRDYRQFAEATKGYRHSLPTRNPFPAPTPGHIPTPISTQPDSQSLPKP